MRCKACDTENAKWNSWHRDYYCHTCASVIKRTLLSYEVPFDAETREEGEVPLLDRGWDDDEE